MGRKNLLAVVALSASLLGGLTIASGSASALTYTAGSCADGCYAVLNSDVNDGITVEEGATAYIDLGGHAVKNADGYASIINKGTITITGEGTVSATAGSTAAMTNYPGATATISGGTFSSDNWYTIRNYGTMTLNDGVTVTNMNLTNNSSMITNGWVHSVDVNNGENVPAPTKTGSTNLTINGGTYTIPANSSNAVKNDDYGIAIINGGTFIQEESNTDNYGSIVLNWNKLTINGGDFTLRSNKVSIVATGYLDDESDRGETVINGGKFTVESEDGTIIGFGSSSKTGEKASLKVTDGEFSKALDIPTKDGENVYTPEISGGTYGAKPVDGTVAEGYAAFEAEDGTYYVAEDKAENITITASDEVTEDTDDDHTSNEKTLSDSIYAVITKIADSLSTLVKDSEVTDEESGVTATISDAEKLTTAIKNKEALSVVLATKESSVSKETKAYIESVALPEGSTMLDTNEVWVALKDGDDELAELTQLTDEVTVVLTDIKADAEVADGYTRTWGVVRVHYNSKSNEYDYDLLTADYDEDEKTLTFTSDEFSEFVAYYTDTENATDDDDEDTKGDDTTDDEDTKGDDTTDDEDTKGDDTTDDDDTKGDDESDDTTDTDTTDTDTDEETDTDTDSESDADTDTDTNSEEDEEESSESSDTTTPETGRFTAEEEGASDTQIITIVASIVVLAGIIGFAIKAKKSAKKNA